MLKGLPFHLVYETNQSAEQFLTLNMTFWIISSCITSSVRSLCILVTQVRAMKSYLESVSGRFISGEFGQLLAIFLYKKSEAGGRGRESETAHFLCCLVICKCS